MPPNQRLKIWIACLTMLVNLVNGCDDRVTKVATTAADRQAQQNLAMAELNKEVAAGTQSLVKADAEARKEIVGVHRDFQAERTRLDTSLAALEDERRQIAGERRTESILVPVVQALARTRPRRRPVGFLLAGSGRTGERRHGTGPQRAAHRRVPRRSDAGTSRRQSTKAP